MSKYKYTPAGLSQTSSFQKNLGIILSHDKPLYLNTKLLKVHEGFLQSGTNIYISLEGKGIVNLRKLCASMEELCIREELKWPYDLEYGEELLAKIKLTGEVVKVVYHPPWFKDRDTDTEYCRDEIEQPTLEELKQLARID